MDACVDILMRQNKYLNNLVEQDHRAVKRVTQPMLGLKVLLERSNPDRRNRNHAHDQEEADGLSQGINYVRSTAVLRHRCLINGLEMQILSVRLH